MLIDYTLRFIKLLGSASIVIALSYLLTTTAVGRRLLSIKERAFTHKDQWLVCMVFGGFAFYNSLSITTHGADARIIGPLLAGFIAGPIVGTGVAVIGIFGALVEYVFNISMSAENTGNLLDSIVVINLLAGLGAGLYQHHKKCLIGIGRAALFVLLFDIFIIFPTEIFLADNQTAFWKTAILIFPPMLVVHISSVVLFLLLIRNFDAEQNAKAIEQKITLEKGIAQKIFQSLYSDTKKSTPATEALTFVCYPETDTAQYTNRFIARTTANNYCYFSYGYFFGAQTPVAMAISYLKPLFENLAQNHSSPQEIHAALKENLRAFSGQNVRLRLVCSRINLRDNFFEYYGSKNCRPLLIRGHDTQILSDDFTLRNEDVIAIVNIETNILPPLREFLNIQNQLTDALYITVHNNPKTVARFNRSLARDTALISQLMEQCREFCQVNNLQARTNRDIGLLLDETVSNAIKYSGVVDLNDSSAISVNVAFELETRLLEVTVSWKGDYFDPLQYTKVPDQAARIPGGWGIFLIKKLTDTITFERKNDYNTLIMQRTYA
ncbi:MAG: ATP-binding protein [Negativicutes bacterium]|jgi:anti-sigma regulatory factor (Ser/Thr protein kinase)